MNFWSYFKLQSKVILSSSFVLACSIGIPILVFGDDDMVFDLTLEYEAIDGLFLIVIMPIVAIIVFSALSPLSLWVFRLINGSEERTDT